ncbi:hypothetical protein DTW89_04750 [Acidovorax sp. BoFeN1]|nr:hypothetical protein DTW89_04750 [Acidovorax sp. BoFeN1]
MGLAKGKPPLSRLRRLPPEGDDALAAGRPLLGVSRLACAGFMRFALDNWAQARNLIQPSALVFDELF